MWSAQTELTCHVPPEEFLRVLDDLSALGLRHAELGYTSRVYGESIEPCPGRLPVGALARVFENAEHLTGDPQIGLHAAERATLTHVVALMAASQSTLREGLEQYRRFQSLLLGAEVLSIREGATTTMVVLGGANTPAALRHVVEYYLTVLSREFVSIAGPLATPLEVRFAHVPVGAAAEYERVLGAPVRFRADASMLCLAHRAVETELPSADPHVAAALVRLATEQLTLLRQQALHERVAAAIRSAMTGTGEATCARIARQLAMSVRTLQRRLGDEGVTFRGLRDTVRRDLAIELSAEQGPLGGPNVMDLAMCVGFSDSATLCRAFKRWTGTSPGVFRSERARRATHRASPSRPCRTRVRGMMSPYTAATANLMPEPAPAAPIQGLRGEWADALLAELRDEDIAIDRRAHRLLGRPLRQPLCRVPVVAVADLLSHAAGHRNDPLLGIHLAQRRRPRGLLHYLLISQPTVEAWLDQLARFAEILLTGETIRIADVGDTRVLGLWPSLPLAHRQLAEACLATVCLDMQEAAEVSLRFEEVRLRGMPLAAPAEYEEVFGCRVRFEQSEPAVVLGARALQARLRRRNRSVAERLERMAHLEVEILSRSSVRERAELIVRAAMLEGERCKRAAVAERLVCSPRVFRRWLESEGASFREIEEQVRRDLALALVGGTRLPLVEVAERCGFAGLPAFSKAFRRWTARAPSAFRHSAASATSEAFGEGLRPRSACIPAVPDRPPPVAAR